MPFSDNLLTYGYFPLLAKDIPFGDMLNQIFFLPLKENEDFPIHGPNAIRFIRALVEEGDLAAEPGLLKDHSRAAQNFYGAMYERIMEALLEKNIDFALDFQDKERIAEFLKVAALYHDMGKYIRRANHPQIGYNLLRNYHEMERLRLVDLLIYENEPYTIKAKYNRFSLISSITQHHDKFGVVCTGEGGLPLFSDILYFTSGEATIGGIKKNLTSVMLMNLADIAAVNTAPEEDRRKAVEIAKKVGKQRSALTSSSRSEDDWLDGLLQICQLPSSCLGISMRKLQQVLTDWQIVMDSIELPIVKGNRVQLKNHLLELERNPARAIQRVQRVLQESIETTRATALFEQVTETSVESILVGILGAHQFQTFCEQLATVAKLDYGLKFFQSVLCACVRKEIYPNYNLDNNSMAYRLTPDESECLKQMSDSELLELASKITILFVRVLERLVSRYAGVLGYSASGPRRFGFQMRNLTDDPKIRDTILDLFCIKDLKDPIALTWIADEVTIWSMD